MQFYDHMINQTNQNIIYRMKQLFILWFLILLVGRLNNPIQSTNLTSVEIPESVEEMVWGRVEPKSDVSITYTRQVNGSSELAEVEICYEVVIGETKLFGFASKV